MYTNTISVLCKTKIVDLNKIMCPYNTDALANITRKIMPMPAATNNICQLSAGHKISR